MSNGFHKGADLGEVPPNGSPKSTASSTDREKKNNRTSMGDSKKTKIRVAKRKPKRGKKLKLWILVLFVVIGFCVISFFLWRSIAFTKDKASKVIKQEVCAILGCDQEEISPLMQAIASEMQVQVKKLEKTQDGYTAVCSVGNHDFQKAVEQVEMVSQNEQSLNDYVLGFADIYKRQPYLTQEMTIELKKADSTYSLLLTEEQADAFTGGVLSYYAETYTDS